MRTVIRSAIFSLPSLDLPAAAASYQSAWEKPAVEAGEAIIWNHFSNNYTTSPDWLQSRRHTTVTWLHPRAANVKPAACRLRLDNESVRMVVELRLSLPIFVPHTCQCGAMVCIIALPLLQTMLRSHGLPYQHINDPIWRAVSQADIPVSHVHALFQQMSIAI